MKIRIVSHYGISPWILGKFARKLDEHLRALGDDVTIGGEVDPTADVNHHIAHYDPMFAIPTVQTHMLTHVDDIQKFHWLREQMPVLDSVVCMSRETVNNLTGMGLPREKLVFINPAHDGVIVPRPLVIGISCRVQEDGRKREVFVDEIARIADPSVFSFKIMGDGWEPQVHHLRERGFHVDHWTEFEYDAYVTMIPTLDYYLYTGMDEGQMGFVDAVAAGVRTIVTRQGYHLDADDAVTHPFVTLEELVGIFRRIEDDRKRFVNSVATWTWRDYAIKHRELWAYLLALRSGDAPSRPQSAYPDGINSLFDAVDQHPLNVASFGAMKRSLVKEYFRHRYYHWKNRFRNLISRGTSGDSAK